jgi:16S rRNA (guanine527-N7)-methyltransferase
LAAPAGQFLAMKGLYPQEELAALPPGFELLGVHKLIIKGLAAERHLVCIKRK